MYETESVIAYVPLVIVTSVAGLWWETDEQLRVSAENVKTTTKVGAKHDALEGGLPIFEAKWKSSEASLVRSLPILGLIHQT